MTPPWGTGAPTAAWTSPPRRDSRCWGEGQVEEVYSDPMMGTTVTVQQPDGVTAVYSNLAEEVAVSVGDAVETGAVLGTVGGTAIAESGMESHLHLELLAEGNHVDPLDYLPEQS